MSEGAGSNMKCACGLSMVTQNEESAHAKNFWMMECFDKDGELKWREEFGNLVTTEGKTAYLEYTIAGTGDDQATPVWYVGLKDTGTEVVADTMASHASWAELSAIYSQGTRPAFTEAAPAAGSTDNSAAKAVFSITSTDDVYGAFLVSDSVKGTTAGELLCVGDFAAPRSVVNGDTLNVQVTLTIT